MAVDRITEIDIGACIAYIERMGADPSNYEMFVVVDIVQTKSLGVVERSGFVNGWSAVFDESKGTVAPTWEAQKSYIRQQIALVRTDPAQFVKVYRSAFTTCKELGQREMEMGRALDFWELLFQPTMGSWHSAHVDWLAAWKGYLQEKFMKATTDGKGDVKGEYTRSVSKDLWNQTRLFAARTMEDETLGFWSEEQAWPGLIDEFVVWCREKGKVGPQNGNHMEE